MTNKNTNTEKSTIKSAMKKAGDLAANFLKVSILVAGAGTVGVLSVGLDDEAGMKRVLDNDGYTDVKYTETRTMACGKGDIYRTGFSAINANDKKVTGTVCSGLFKGNTIRID